MRSRRLGKTDLQVSEIALGTWGLSGDGYSPVSESDQDKVIERATFLGVTLFETADCYGAGEMEKRLGERLADEQDRHIVTKVGTDLGSSPPRKRFDSTFLRDSVERSRDRLRRDSIDVVLLHNPSEAMMAKDETTAAMRELVETGAIRSWGVSAGSSEVARAAIARGAQVIEIAYNAFWSRQLSSLSEDVTSKDVGILAHSILAYGLLCGHWPPTKDFPEGDHRADRWTPEELRLRLKQLDALRSLIGGPVLTMRAAALRFVLSADLVSSAVIGPRSSVQLDQLVREAGRGPPYLSDAKLSKLATRLADVGVDT